MAWVSSDPSQEDSEKSLVLNVRRDTKLIRVRYVYNPSDRSITRFSDRTPVRIAAPSLRNFYATPFIEILYDPSNPNSIPILGKLWLEVEFDLAADDGAPGSKAIASRYIHFSTRLLPSLLNASLRSDWSL